MTDKKYMKVCFHDNDFGGYVSDAVKRLWGWIHESNAHCLNAFGEGDSTFSDRTLTDIFHELNKAGSLAPMIERLIDAEYIAGDVEFNTRGLYWTKVDWEDAKKLPENLRGCTDYLHVDITFRKTPDRKWRNGEIIMLNTETGEVKSL